VSVNDLLAVGKTVADVFVADFLTIRLAGDGDLVLMLWGHSGKGDKHVPAH
jgi:hypothetical protein